MALKRDVFSSQVATLVSFAFSLHHDVFFFFPTIFFVGGIIREEEFMKDFYAEDLQVTIYHCFRDHVMFYPKNHDP